MVMLIDNILSGLGTSSSRSGSTESYTVTRPVSNTPHGRGSTGSYQSGTVSQTKTVTYEYDPVAKTYVETNVVVKDIENPTYSRNNGTNNNNNNNNNNVTASPTEDDDNILIYMLLPILAIVLGKIYQNNKKPKKRK